MRNTGRMITTTGTSAVPSVWPTVAYRDEPGALRFLTEAFGFTERAVYRDGDQLVHVELTWSGPDGTVVGGIMFGSIDETDPDRAPYGRTSVHVVTDDPDSLHDRAVAAGAVLVRPLEDTEYGSRAFVVRDPEGNIWSFGTWYEK